MPTPIDTLYQQQKDLLDYLKEQKELSHHATASVLFQKTLLLGVASYFEHAISEIVVRFLNQYGNGHEGIVSFAKKKGVDRQYHTYFGWDGNNANSFFALFGPTFLARSKEEVKRSPDLNNAIRAFLDLGNSRNELVHLNFVTFTIEKTADEIYALYKTAAPFVSWLEQALGLAVHTAPAEQAAPQAPAELVTIGDGAAQQAVVQTDPGEAPAPAPSAVPAPQPPIPPSAGAQAAAETGGADPAVHSTATQPPDVAAPPGQRSDGEA